MDLVAFEYDRKFVLEGLRNGEVDYVEHVSEAAEADLFRHLISRNMGRLKTAYNIDTIVPLKKNMNAYQDVMGLTRLKDFR